MRDYDVAVLGLGGIGSAAAYWLSRSGARVLGLEQFELGHVRGESHDHSRIIRLSYHTPQYVELAKEAYAAWSALEAETGETLVVRTGGLDLGPRDGPISLQAYADSLSACNVPFERLQAAEIRHRWPQFSIGDDVHGIYQSEGGIVAAARATAAHQAAANARGAVLHERAGIRSLRDRGDHIEIVAAAETYRVRKLIVTAGPWTGRVLANFDVALPLEVTKEQVAYFAPQTPDAYAIGAFPVWIWMDDPCFYGFPTYGQAGVKVAQDAGGRPVDPDARSFEPDAAMSARVRDFVRRTLPTALNGEVVMKTCLYTLTPERDFVIDMLPEHANVCVAIGAGHAFKFAGVIGRILSDLALRGTTSSDIAGFEVDRPILRMADPPKTYRM